MGNCCEPNFKQNQNPEFNKILNSLNILFENSQIYKGTSPNTPKDLEKLPNIPKEYITKIKQPCKPLELFEFKFSKKNCENEDQNIYGPYKMPKNEVYVGQFKNGRKEGKGFQIWEDGSYYEGYWEADKMQGFGRIVHHEGDVYEGEWEKGHACGKGIFYHQNGVFFEGEWKDDIQNGQGFELWPDGVEYRGEYLAGKKHGKGEFLWKSRDRYVGSFENDDISGYGEYYWNDCKVYKGYWKNNKMNGEGEFLWSNGKKFKGFFLNDKKHGKGYFIFPDGREKHAEWKFDKIIDTNLEDIQSDENDEIDTDRRSIYKSIKEKNFENSFNMDFK